MQDIIGPISLVQKYTISCRCLKCGVYFSSTISDDGSYCGGLYFGVGPPNTTKGGFWMCDKCAGIKPHEDKPKEKIGFRVG